MKLYLAHHLKNRHEIRKWELNFEKKTGIKLINPFYDSKNREDIKIIDTMKDGSPEQLQFITERTPEECQFIVELDLKLIRKSDGLVAFVNKSIGTSMEIIMAYRVFKIPVYIISEKYNSHAWIKYNSTKQFNTKEEFEEYATKNLSRRRV